MSKKQNKEAVRTGRATGGRPDRATKISSPIAQPQEFITAVEVRGTAPLIQNAFGQKTIEQMLRKHMGLAVQKEAKKPRECIEQATIRNIKGEVCIPPVAFKKGMISASVAIKGMKKTHLRIQMFIKGNSIPITYDEMVPRMDMVRTAGISRAPDVRFRPMFENWSARLVITFNELLKPETVLDLLNRAGDIGVGEWRPEKDGTFGTYRVSDIITDAKTINEIRDACAVPLVPLVIPDWAMDAEIDPEVLERIATSQVTDQEAAA